MIVFLTLFNKAFYAQKGLHNVARIYRPFEFGFSLLNELLIRNVSDNSLFPKGFMEGRVKFMGQDDVYSNKVDSKEVGLSIGLILGRYFLGTDDLHYGFWPMDLEVSFKNFVKAQELHSELIISNIPKNVKTILDVGCGAGVLAKKLIAKGYEVECISPYSVLSERAIENLSGKAPLHECYFENFTTSKTFDLILFSESFQYVDLEKSIPLVHKLLKPQGHLLICDFFKTEAPGKSPIGGGHKLAKFFDIMSKNSFKEILNRDITKETAPNIDLLGSVYDHVGLPIKGILSHYFSTNYPTLTRLVSWKFRHRFKKINDKYFSKVISGKAFSTHKTYRLFVFQKV